MSLKALFLIEERQVKTGHAITQEMRTGNNTAILSEKVKKGPQIIRCLEHNIFFQPNKKMKFNFPKFY